MTTTVYVKGIPEDVFDFILKTQSEIKRKKCVGKYSLSQTIIHIIKEHKKKTEK